MTSRTLCLVCLLASPALGEVIHVTDGDNYDRLNIVPGRELIMDGGYVGVVNNFGGISTINDGFVGRIDNRYNTIDGQHVKSKLVVNGFDNPPTDGLNIMINGGTDTEIHGYNFRVRGFGNHASSGFSIKGWMLDGRFVEFGLNRLGEARGQKATIILHDPAFVDPDGDWDFDLDDMNAIRNSFGQNGDQHAGDTNFDGVVDLSDINVLRNRFGGYDQQGWPIEWEFSGDLPLETGVNLVPEPTSFITAALLGLGVLSTIAGPRRLRWWHQRDL